MSHLRNGEYRYSFGEFMEDNPAFAYIVFGVAAFLVFCLFIGSFMSGQKSDAQAQCESLGGIYGSSHCYIKGEDAPLKVNRNE